MSTAVYLFCNEAYGRAFEAVFVEHSRQDRSHDWRIVHSTRNRRRPGIRERAKRAIDSARQVLGATQASRMYVQDVNSKDFVDSIEPGAIGVVAGFNQIFKPATIERFSIIVNFHPSILPHYSGAIPSYWALKNGESRSGFTAHVLTSKVDNGPILHQEYVAIPASCGEQELDHLISTRAAAYLDRSMDELLSGRGLTGTLLDSPYVVKVETVPSKRH